MSQFLDAEATIFSPPNPTVCGAEVRERCLLSFSIGTDGPEAGGGEGEQIARHPCKGPSAQGGSPAPHQSGQHPHRADPRTAPSLSAGPCFRTLSTLSELGWGGASGGGDSILLGSLKTFGIFTMAHVIFKLLPLSTPSCLPWLPQVNL